MTALTAKQYRHVLGHLPTGVTVVTAHSTDGPAGMTANSVTSVSLAPPLVLLCPAKASSTWPHIRNAGRFCINIMAGHHEQTIRRFAQADIDRFAGVPTHDRPAGIGIDQAVAWIECDLREEHDAGDHTIAVAEVVAIEASEKAEPLVFFRGKFHAWNAR